MLRDGRCSLHPFSLLSSVDCRRAAGMLIGAVDFFTAATTLRADWRVADGVGRTLDTVP